jgi:hypothetical protein
VHAARSDAEISTITHFAGVPRKELPQEAPPDPVPVCPPAALADLHDAHPHPGFARRQHSAHVENPPAFHDATMLQMGKISQFCGDSLTAGHPSSLVNALSRSGLWFRMIFAQTRYAFVARENRYTLFRLMREFKVATQCPCSFSLKISDLSRT